MARRGENIYKRQDGRWEGRYISGKKANGGAKYSSVYGKTYAEVKEELAKRKAAQHARLPRCCLTVKELFDLWLASRVSNVKASSYMRYEILVQQHILPRLGELYVHSLTVEKLNGFIDEKLLCGRLDGHGGLAPKTVCDLVIVLRSALRMARKRYSVADEVFSEVKLPVVHQKKIQTMGERETARFSSAALQSKDLSGAAYLLSLNNGLRLGEICALRWSDIDFVEGELHIERTVLRLRGGLVLQTPKSAASQRTVPLTAEMLKLLKRLRGNALPDSFVLTGSTECPMDPRTLQYRFRSFLQAHGFRLRNYHSLRHCFASRCIERGMDAKTLSELLGHSNVKTTLQLYVHPSMAQKRVGVQAVSTISCCA